MHVRTNRLEAAAGVLALVVAGTHLYWGIPRFAAYTSVGAMPDPRPLAFVLSGHAVALAVTLVALGVVDSRRTYVPGILLMAAHVAAYVAWHTVLAHGGAGHGHDHVHLGVVAAHLAGSPLALASKVAEVGVLVLLAALLYGDGTGPSR